ncbi:hypothetical protein VTN77DRAFT_1571 [Rasamsonia byssochlamydoides]|uniref:uncharacterized protein n=1 Tax=Rasamsonia byssochlamydoides TaxID=89139 RepID=UPI003744B1DF
MGLHNSSWVLPVRLVQAAFAVIVLGLSAYLINLEYNIWWGSTDSVNFMLFNSIWTLLIALPYLALVPIYFAQFSNVYIILAVEVLTMIFWFAGFIALADQLPPTRACVYSACRSAQAASVFGAFEWVLFLVTSAFAVLRLRSGNGTAARAKTGPQVAAHASV